MRGREFGGAIAGLGETVLFPGQGPEQEVSQEMGECSLNGHDVVDR